jgi:hypothetical protein
MVGVPRRLQTPHRHKTTIIPRHRLPGFSESFGFRIGRSPLSTRVNKQGWAQGPSQADSLTHSVNADAAVRASQAALLLRS